MTIFDERFDHVIEVLESAIENLRDPELRADGCRGHGPCLLRRSSANPFTVKDTKTTFLIEYEPSHTGAAVACACEGCLGTTTIPL